MSRTTHKRNTSLLEQNSRSGDGSVLNLKLATYKPKPKTLTLKPEHFCGQSKAGTFKCEHFTKLLPGLPEILASTGPTSHLLSFVSMSYNYFIWTKY